MKSLVFYLISLANDLSCPVSPWSEWSECSVTCGPNGIRHRSRRLLNQHTAVDQYRCRSIQLEESQPCHLQRCRMYLSANLSIQSSCSSSSC